MRETDFIANNQEKWQRYERALEASEQDPELLRELYIHTTDDLSYSRTFYPNRSVRVYLNHLAQQTFLQISRGRKGEAGRFVSFWTDELPRVVHANRRPLLVSLLLFLLAMLIGVISYRIDNDFAATIMGEGYMAMTRDNIESGDPMAVYKEMSPFNMTLAITVNNIYVALLTFVSGALFAIGSVVQLLRNGIMLGVFQYFFYDQGIFQESFLTIWIHGALEISSIVIAGGAGLTMGMGLLFPGTLSRLASFKRSARAGLKIFLGTVPLFIIAGFLESYLTRHTELPDGIRLAFILLCFGFVYWYFVAYPRAVARRPVAASYSLPGIARAKDAVVDRRQLRGPGENLETTFSILRRSAGLLFMGAGLLAGAFTLLSFGFFGGASFARYFFDGRLLVGDLQNYYELFTTFSRDRGWTYLLLVAAYFYGVWKVAFVIFWRSTDLDVLPANWRSEAYLALVAIAVATLLAFGPLLVALASLLAFPFLFILAYVGYTGMAKVGRTVKYVGTNFLTAVGNMLLIYVLIIPSMWLIDTVAGHMLFSFLDWVVYTDPAAIDNLNVVFQAFTYLLFFSVMFILLSVSFALSAHKIWEIAEAEALLEKIESVGTKRRLRGMEME